MVHLIEQPQIKVDVVRCRGWRDDTPPAVEFILLKQQVGEEDAAAHYEVLDRQSNSGMAIFALSIAILLAMLGGRSFSTRQRRDRTTH